MGEEMGIEPVPFAERRVAGGTERVEWEPSGSGRHVAVIGPTGSGKSAVIRTLVVQAAWLGFHVFVGDLKRIEFEGFKTTGWPNVEQVATDLDEMTLLIERVHALQEERFSALQDARPEALRQIEPVVVVVDEAREWIDSLAVEWIATGGEGDHPTVKKFWSLARLARAARIYLVVGLQRPDATFFGGEARGDFGTRVVCGQLSPQGMRMVGLGETDRVFESGPGRVMADVGQGWSRVMADVGEGWTEVQLVWTPDPGDDLTSSDQDVVDRLRAETRALAPLTLPGAGPATG